MENLTSGQKAMLWIFGALEWLKTNGIVEGGNFEISDKGISEFDQLETSGYRPSLEEISDICYQLSKSDEEFEAIFDPEDVEGIIALLYYRTKHDEVPELGEDPDNDD